MKSIQQPMREVFDINVLCTNCPVAAKTNEFQQQPCCMNAYCDGNALAWKVFPTILNKAVTALSFTMPSKDLSLCI